MRQDLKEAVLNSFDNVLYPRVDKGLDNIYKFQNHYLKICTIDLNMEWNQIHNRLIELLEINE